MGKQEEKVLKKILKVNTEHKSLTNDISKKSMNKKEQRVWNSLTIFLMVLAILLGGGILYLLSFNDDPVGELKIEISPSKVMLNEDADLDFEITFTNIGKLNLSNFDILKIDLYREEGNNLVFKRQIKLPWENKDYSISCSPNSFTNNGNLIPGGNCVVKVDMHSCPDCFDDKDKNVYFLIYIDSIPPIKNQKIQLPIY